MLTPELSADPSYGTLGLRSWRNALLLLGLLLGGALLLTWPVWARIFEYAARNEEQSHSFLAMPVAAWLIWVRRRRFALVRPQSSFLGPLLMIAGWGGAVAGFRTGVDLGLHLGALCIVLGAALAALGPAVFRRFAPAVGALLMILPIPGRVRFAIAAPLQEWSAAITAWILELCGIAVQRSGNLLTLNGVDVAVAEACNGMRMVSALAIVTYAYVFTAPMRPAARIGILAISPVIALAVNVLRLTPTTLIYGNYPLATAEAFHDISGWAVLVVAVGLLLGLTSLLRWLEIPIDSRNSPGHSQPPAWPPQNFVARFWPAAAAAAVLVLVQGAGGFDARRHPGTEAYFDEVRLEIEAVPYRIGDAVGIDRQVSPGTTRILKPNAILQRQYGNPETGRWFGLTIVHCGDVRDLVGHYPPVCYPAHGWRPAGSTPTSVLSGRVDVPARIYDFTRQSGMAEIRTRVASFFVLPAQSGGLVDNMEAVTAASRTARVAGLGAAHVLVSFAGDTADDEIARVMQAVLEHLEPAIRTTARGLGDE